MQGYFACGKQKKRFVPLCAQCFEFWGDTFKNNAGIECEFDDDDIDTTLDDGIGKDGEFIVNLIRLHIPDNHA